MPENIKHEAHLFSQNAPSQAMAYFLRAVAHEQKNEAENAVHYYQEAIKKAEL